MYLFDPNWVDIGIEAKCHICGKVIAASFTYGDARYYCSRECLDRDFDVR